jgi:homocitrate synthase NifV
MMSDAVKFAKDNDLYVSVNAEDASRSDLDYLTEFALIAKHAGANRLRFCDTVGTLNPLTTFRYIKTLHDAVGLDIEMHTHNDFGMATANSLSGCTAVPTMWALPSTVWEREQATPVSRKLLWD